jgi:hypothetical protein
MALVNPVPPHTPVGELSLRGTLLELTSGNLCGEPGSFFGHRLDEIRYADPHRNYYVDAAAIAEGALLAAASAKTWRYFLLTGNQVTAELEVSSLQSTKGEEFVDQLIAVHRDGSAAATLEILKEAEALPEAQQADFEIRFLMVPALNFTSVWLHSSTVDFLLPTTSAIPGLKKGFKYEEPAVVEVLQPFAREAIRFAHLESTQF